MRRATRLIVAALGVLSVLGLGLICLFFVSDGLPDHVLSCGSLPSPPAIYRVIWPLRLSTTLFLHRNCPEKSAPAQEFRVITWPTWASRIGDHSTVDINGYAVALPDCAAETRFQFDLVNRILGITGLPLDSQFSLANSFRGNPSKHPALQVSPDYLSVSISGAKIRLDASEQDLVHTNRLGHFDLAASVLSTDARIQDHVVKLHCPKQPKAVKIPDVFADIKAFHLEENSLIIVSDIDDLLRVAEVWNWHLAMRKLFLEPFQPWMGIDHILRDWQRVPDVHFHYATDAPELSNEFYVRGVEENFPPGSFSFRPMAFKSLSQVLNSRYENIGKLVAAFPKGKFVLMADSATGSALSSYSRLAREFPERVQCILIRNVSATEPANWILPNLAQLPTDRTVMFDVPSDLVGFDDHLLHLANGSVKGCGELLAGRSLLRRPHIHGGFASWMATLWNGLTAFMECMWLTDRPAPRYCRFDKQSTIEGQESL